MAWHSTGGTDHAYWAVAPAPPSAGCVSLWFKTTQATANPILASYWNVSSRNGWGLILNNTANKLTAQGYKVSDSTPAFNFTGSATVNDGNPHHALLNYNRTNGGANELFIDGASQGSGNSIKDWTTASTGFFVEIGDNTDTFWPTFVGDIWSLAQWSVNLNADEIAGLAKGITPKLIRPTALFVHAPLVRDLHEIRNADTVGSSGGSTTDQGRMVGGAV